MRTIPACGDLYCSTPLLEHLTPDANGRREAQIREFYRSQIHQDYSNHPVDERGTTATRRLRDRIASKA